MCTISILSVKVLIYLCTKRLFGFMYKKKIKSKQEDNVVYNVCTMYKLSIFLRIFSQLNLCSYKK